MKKSILMAAVEELEKELEYDTPFLDECEGCIYYLKEMIKNA